MSRARITAVVLAVLCRGGSCFANTYRKGALFLLFLKQRNGRLTVNWYALGPVNEQIRSENDPWLRWVRQQLRD